MMVEKKLTLVCGFCSVLLVVVGTTASSFFQPLRSESNLTEAEAVKEVTREQKFLAVKVDENITTYSSGGNVEPTPVMVTLTPETALN